MNKRPLVISAICVLGLLASLYAATLFLSTRLWTVPPTPGQRAAALAAVACTTVSLYGMWRMRRWGVYLLAVLLAARIAFGFAAHLPWNAAALAGPVGILLVGLLYLKRMT